MTLFNMMFASAAILGVCAFGLFVFSTLTWLAVEDGKPFIVFLVVALLCATTAIGGYHIKQKNTTTEIEVVKMQVTDVTANVYEDGDIQYSVRLVHPNGAEFVIEITSEQYKTLVFITTAQVEITTVRQFGETVKQTAMFSQ